VQRNEIIRLLENPIAKAFLKAHAHANAADLALSMNRSSDFDMKLATQILHLYHKSSQKLPTWTENMLAMDKRSYEQSSAEAVAKFRSTLIKGDSLLDVTSGLGVDSTFLSKSFKNVIAIDRNPDLVEFAAFNDQKLGIQNIQRVHANATDWPGIISQSKQSNLPIDTVFVDPDRRTLEGKRIQGLEQSEPPILEWLPDLLNATKRVFVKCSPLLDIKAALRYSSALKALYVIALNDEVKEVLLEFDRGSTNSNTEIHAIDIGRPQNHLKASDLSESQMNFGHDQGYLYEPSAAIRKAELAKNYAASRGLCQINSKSDYYLSNSPIDNWCGRQWFVHEHFAISWSALKKNLKNKGITKAHILRKNFPDSAQLIRKRLNLKEGGEHYLVFAKTKEGKGWCYFCTRKE